MPVPNHFRGRHSLPSKRTGHLLFKSHSMEREIVIAATADLHGYLPKMPRADLSVVGGDIFPGGMDRDPVMQGKWFGSYFIPWVEAVPSERIILIAGNHDYWLEENNEALLREYAPSAGKKLIYLCDSGCELCGLTVYGTPWAPKPFHNFAFTLPGEGLRERFSKIPSEVDLLLTHAVPKGCGKVDVPQWYPESHGCEELYEALSTRVIRYLVGGHIHAPSERSVTMDFGSNETYVYNAACCDQRKNPYFPPMLIRVAVK